MALYAFDGTGNEEKGADKNSNVRLFFMGYEDPLKNDDCSQVRGSLYLKGIGTRADDVEPAKAVAEAFGIGGWARIIDMMNRLENNLAAGDGVVDVIGFSRGAALAISFSHVLAAKHPDLTIRFIGVWDIVGEFGLPGRFVNCGHDLGMPTNANRVYHAMALDEHRDLFQLTRLGSEDTKDDRLREVWFRGVHSDVGGGNANMSLNWIALNWMYENALREGLPIHAAEIASNLARRLDPAKISDKFEVGQLRRIRKSDLLHSSVQLDDGNLVHPHNNPKFEMARIDDTGKITPVRTGPGSSKGAGA